MELNEIAGKLQAKLTPLFDLMEVAEEEIEAAQKRFHEPVGEGDGPIWNSFGLLVPSHPEMVHESLYRVHCRELLDRVGRGEDTRPATSAEMIFALSEASLQAPLTSAAAGLYLKLGMKCFPDVMSKVMDDIGRTVGDYERIHGQDMKAHEEYLKRRLRQEWRTREG